MEEAHCTVSNTMSRILLSWQKLLTFATNCLLWAQAPLLLSLQPFSWNSSLFLSQSRSFANSKWQANTGGNSNSNGRPKLKSKGNRKNPKFQQDAPPKRKKEPKDPNKGILAPRPEKRFIPLALLLPTASCFAYVSHDTAFLDGEKTHEHLPKVYLPAVWMRLLL
jgi:hypothetical protein